MKKLKVIIDTDIGDDIDDAFALLVALANKNLEILGITTVYKNCHERAKIVKSILKLVGRNDIPVYVGEDKPLNSNIIKWNHETIEADGKIRICHYNEDMAYEEYNKGNASDFILEIAKKYPGEVTLVGLGPHTNIANAILKDRDSFIKLKDAYIMAGESEGKYNEWNIRVDPEATRIFLSSGFKINMITLNCTIKCKLFDDDIKRIRQIKSDAVQLVTKMMDLWIKCNNKMSKIKNYPIMHDPLCVLNVIENGICDMASTKIKVININDADGFIRKSSDGQSINYSKSLNLDKFYEKFFNYLEIL